MWEHDVELPGTILLVRFLFIDIPEWGSIFCAYAFAAPQHNDAITRLVCSFFFHLANWFGYIGRCGEFLKSKEQQCCCEERVYGL